jgi:hypothetical protein
MPSFHFPISYSSLAGLCHIGGVARVRLLGAMRAVFVAAALPPAVAMQPPVPPSFRRYLPPRFSLAGHVSQLTIMMFTTSCAGRCGNPHHGCSRFRLLVASFRWGAVGHGRRDLRPHRPPGRIDPVWQCSGDGPAGSAPPARRAGRRTLSPPVPVLPTATTRSAPPFSASPKTWI